MSDDEARTTRYSVAERVTKMVDYIADSVKVRMNFRNAGNLVTWSNDLFLKATTPISETLGGTLASLVAGWLSGEQMPLMGEDAYTTDVVVTDNSAPGLVEVTLPTLVAGSISSAMATVDLCMVTTWKSGMAGRSYRGRTYWRGFTTSALADTVGSRAWSADATNGLQVSSQQWLTTVAWPSGVEPAIFSRKIPAITPITTCLARNGVFTQRRTSQPLG